MPITARADRIGILLRPAGLRALTIHRMLGEADEAVAAVLAPQDAIGFPTVTNAEFWRRAHVAGRMRSRIASSRR